MQLHFTELPHYLTVYIVTKGDSVRVEVHSTIHVNKVNTLSGSYSAEYVTDMHSQFRSDVFDKIVRAYGLTKQPVSYQ